MQTVCVNVLQRPTYEAGASKFDNIEFYRSNDLENLVPGDSFLAIEFQLTNIFGIGWRRISELKSN